jgi:hypothetical protein
MSTRAMRLAKPVPGRYAEPNLSEKDIRPWLFVLSYVTMRLRF